LGRWRGEVEGSEKALRGWLKRQEVGHLVWVEPASGSTVGAPDVMVFKGRGEVVFLELKLGRYKRNGQVNFDVRPVQRTQLRRLRDMGMEVGILVGVPGTGVALLRVEEEALKGVLEGGNSLPEWGRWVMEPEALDRLLKRKWLKIRP
jgi:hypothetical protein